MPGRTAAWRWGARNGAAPGRCSPVSKFRPVRTALVAAAMMYSAVVTVIPGAVTTPAGATALPYSVNLGYADNLRANAVNFPTPWSGGPNVVFEGCTGSCSLDSGAVEVVNNGTTALTV